MSSRIWFRIAGVVDRLLLASSGVIADIKQFGPHLILATPANLRYSNEVEYIRVGNSLGIPTVIYTMTWDNLTTKGLLPIVPDSLLVWNSAQKLEAREIHNIPESIIQIVGSVIFDKWFENDVLPLSREEFAKEVGIPPDRRYVLYLGSSGNIAGDEATIPVELADRLKARLGADLGGFKLVVRPHPANEKVFQEKSDPRVVIWLRGEDRLPDTSAYFSLYLAFLKYAECVVGINTTGMVDAVIYEKSVITLNLPRYHGSNAREAEHIKLIASAGIFFDADTYEIAADAILDSISGKEIVDPKFRSEFISNYVRPVDPNIPAGLIAAGEIMNLVDTMTTDAN